MKLSVTQFDLSPKCLNVRFFFTANADPLTFSNIETRDQFYVVLNMYGRYHFQ